MRRLPPHANIAHVGAVWEPGGQLAWVAPNFQPRLIADLLKVGFSRAELTRHLGPRDLATLVSSREAVASADDAQRPVARKHTLSEAAAAESSDH